MYKTENVTEHATKHAVEDATELETQYYYYNIQQCSTVFDLDHLVTA